MRFGDYGLSVSENYGMQRPKRTFSLYSRLYMPKQFASNKKLRNRSKSKSRSKSISPENSIEKKKNETEINVAYQPNPNPFLENNLGKEDFSEL